MRISEGYRYSLKRLVLLGSIAGMLAGCAGTPSGTPAEPLVPVEAPAAPVEPEPLAEPQEVPEILELRGPVPLPVRIAILLPVPEVSGKDRTSLARVEPAPRPTAPEAPASSGPGLAEAPIPAASTPPKTASVPPAASTTKPSAAPPAKASTPPSKPAPAPEKPASTEAAKKPSSGAPAASSPPAPSPAPVPLAPASTVLHPQEEPAAPTRMEVVSRGAQFELPFQGSGWVYLGETGGREGVRYDSRRFDGASAIFRFAADRTGEYVLKFQRQDPVSETLESQLVGVTVREPDTVVAGGKGSSGDAQIPSPAAPLETAGAAVKSAAPDASGAPLEPKVGAENAGSPSAGGVETSLGTSTAPQPGPAAPTGTRADTSSLPQPLPSTPEELLRLARSELAASHIASTLEVLDKYVSLFPFGSDEAFYLYGKAYEQNTPYRDIKKAYTYYKLVKDEWPRSPFWRDAAERATYIERHYFDIR